MDFTNIDQEVEDEAGVYEMAEKRLILEGTRKTHDAVEDLVDTVREKVKELHQSGLDLPNIELHDRERGSGKSAGTGINITRKNMGNRRKLCKKGKPMGKQKETSGHTWRAP